MTSKLSNPKYPPNTYLNLMQNDPDFLLLNNNGNTNLECDTSGVNSFFNQESPYKFPQLIICDDSKRINQNNDIYQKYSDVIIDECGNRFNIRNINSSAGILQEGYSRNIDLDSHMKNINFYTDKCFYDNWKKAPLNIDKTDKTDKTKQDYCNGLNTNANLLNINYTAVGKRIGECIGNGECKPSESGCCYNTPPTDLNCENNIRKRYNFNHNNFKTESCIKPSEWVKFKSQPVSEIKNIDKYPNTKRSIELLNTINSGIEHEYYKFFDDTNSMHFPAERLFNNNTSRKATPNHHNIYNIEPKYLK